MTGRIHIIGVLALCATLGLAAQQGEYTNNFKYSSGQTIQPIFEGWSHAADGGYYFHFGYLNRNYVEQPHIVIGTTNRIEPGGPDRGQPTYFYARTHRNIFTVSVPKNWGRAAELVWTVTHNGRAQRAVGWLQKEWEIDPVGGASTGGNTNPEYVKNRPPTIDLDPVAPVRLPATATLTAAVRDDGLPIPRPPGQRAVGQQIPTLQGGIPAPVNVPQVAAREAPPGATPASGQRRPRGLSVSWIVWRGPAAVTFDPRSAEPKDGRISVTASFEAPGDYVLRAVASDGSKTTYRNVDVRATETTPVQRNLGR